MAKRTAEKQINNQGHLESENEEIIEVKVADPLTLAKRKIIAPKRLGRKLNSSLTPVSRDDRLERDAKVIALNEQFLQVIQSNLKPDTVADFTSIAQKYITYYSSLSSLDNSQAVSNISIPTLSAFNFGTQNQTSFKTTAFPPSKARPFLDIKSTASKPGNTAGGQAPTGFGGGFGNLSHTPLSTGTKPASDTTTSSMFSAIGTGTNTPAANPAPTLTEPASKDTRNAASKEQANAIEVDSSSSSDEEIEIKGPQFTLTAPPVTKNSPFSFGSKPAAKKDESDSESEIEIKGPTFQFDKPIKDAVFKFDEPASKLSAPAFSFAPVKASDPKPQASISSETHSSTKPQFTFPAKTDVSSTQDTLVMPKNTQSNTAKPLSFGNSGLTGVSAPENLFSSTNNKADSDFTSLKPDLFTPVGANSQDSSTTTQPKPSLFGSSAKFGSDASSAQSGLNPTSISDKSEPTLEAKPFSFRADESSKPSTSSPPTNPLSLRPVSNNTSSQDSAKDETEGPVPPSFIGAKPFSFGLSSDAKKSDSMPTAFGTQKASNQTPRLNFGNGGTSFGVSQAPNGNSQKGAENDSQLTGKIAPSFNFGGSKSDEALTNAKPLFQLSSLDTPTIKTDPEPKPINSLFSFKPAPTSGPISAPSFSFGTNSASANQNETKEATKPLFNFSSKGTATTTSQSPAFNFGNPSSGSPIPSAAFTFAGASKATEQGGKDGDAELVEEESTAQFEPVAKLSEAKVESPVTGEEGEEVLYSQRAKLMLFDPQSSDLPYTNKGVGDLKVLKNSDTGKSRIVIRADGGLRVLLNAPVSKDMSYSTVGTKMVRVPTINPETKKIEFYVFQVKLPEDANQFLETLNSVKG